MSALKIVFVAGERQIVLYATGMKQMWQVESHVLERLGKEERLKLDTATFRKYWIDEEGDRVEIMNDFDFEFFLKRGGHKTPKIYFEAIYSSNVPEQPQPSTGSAQFQAENLSIHSGVECDICKVEPIVGFRYKCLQCPNFDLCLKCEADMKHPDHTMLRIPNSDSGLWKACLFNRRQKKYAAAAAAAGAAPSAGFCGEAPKAEGKSRHHRHHRRHCAGATGAAGIFSNLYDMMQDLAEGGVIAPDSPAAETVEKQQQQQQQQAATAPPQEQASTSDAGAGNTTQSKETNTSPDRSAKSGEAAAGTKVPTTPSLENIQNFIDPHFMKAGIQILNNFSEMFGKILDPAVVGKDNRNGNPSASGNENASRSSSAAPSVVNIDLTGPSNSATPPPTAAGTPQEIPGTKAASAAGSGTVTPMETEVAQPPSPPTSAPRSRNSQSEENDWTMIDNTVATSTTGEDTDVAAKAFAASNAAFAAAAAADTTARAAAASVAAATPQFDFAQLSQQLQSHIENEMKQFSQATNAPTSQNSISTSTVSSTLTSTPSFTVPISTPFPTLTSVPAPAPVPVPAPVSAPVTAPNPALAPVVAPNAAPAHTANTETRAVAVFHADPHINSAVHAMMAMGFSNEGAMLTQLLESVNGSIPLALDLMSAAQRN